MQLLKDTTHSIQCATLHTFTTTLLDIYLTLLSLHANILSYENGHRNMVSITHEKPQVPRNNFYNKIICLGTEIDNFSAIHFICTKCHSRAYFGQNNRQTNRHDECVANPHFQDLSGATLVNARAPQLNTCRQAKHLHLNKNALDSVGTFH